MSEWNPILQLVKNIKNEVKSHVKDPMKFTFHEWLYILKNESIINKFSEIKMDQEKEFLLLHYNNRSSDLLKNSNSILRECKGLVINLEKEELVLTPFRKFFNLNEVEETKEDFLLNEVKNSKCVELADKIDGTMMSMRWYNNDIFISEAKRLKKFDSWKIKESYKRLTDSHINMMKNNNRYTFIFEYVSLKDEHVVKYNAIDEGITLVGIRCVDTGEQFSFTRVREIASIYNIKVIEKDEISLKTALFHLLNMKATEKEGWILYIDGKLVKLKCKDYSRLHHILYVDYSYDNIIKAIFENVFDDLLSYIPKEYISRIEQISEIIYDYIKETERKIYFYFLKASSIDNNVLDNWLMTNVEESLIYYIREKLKGRTYNVLKKNDGNYLTMREITGNLDKIPIIIKDDNKN